MAPDETPAFGSDAWRRTCAHQPYYCEENVWRLFVDERLPEPGAALFVTNAARQVAMWGQRAAHQDPILWDYHVVALLPGRKVVVDLDDRERAVWPVRDWLRHAFRPWVEPELQPRFRVVPQAVLLATFSTDRSHMRGDDGTPTRPAPPWPAPFQPALGMTLPRLLDLGDASAGVVTDAGGLLALVAS